MTIKDTMEKYNPLTTDLVIQNESSDIFSHMDCESNKDTLIGLCNKIIKLCNESIEMRKSMIIKGNPSSEKFYSELIANDEKQKELIMQIINAYEKG